MRTSKVRAGSVSASRSAARSRGGAPWLDVFEGEDLEEALSRARAETAYEAAVSVVTNRGGLIYWTSAAPDVFNSTVVQP
jgi:hypothetical protein